MINYGQRLIRQPLLLQQSVRLMGRSSKKKPRKLCRHVFPFPKGIDVFSLRPEPYCKATGKCPQGGYGILFAGIIATLIGSFLMFRIPVQKIWYNFDEEDVGDDD